MGPERRVWFAGGAIASLLGASGAAVLVRVLALDESPVMLLVALVSILALAQFVRRSRSLVAARIWSATSWLGISGVVFWAAAIYLGDQLPLGPMSLLLQVAFAAIWAGLTGMFAAGLFELGGWLASHTTDGAKRPQS